MTRLGSIGANLGGPLLAAGIAFLEFLPRISRWRFFGNPKERTGEELRAGVSDVVDTLTCRRARSAERTLPPGVRLEVTAGTSRNSGMMTCVSQWTEAATIRFQAVLDTIDTAVVARLPDEASRRLPSRGQVAVQGSINGYEFQTVVEPDGLKGHWIKIDEDLREVADIGAAGNVSFAIEATRDWPEPVVPPDLAAAVTSAPKNVRDIWDDITPMARWEWVRWVNATPSPVTRRRRVEVTISKMNNGKRRPCCFDLSACTDPALSKNGKLRSAT